MDTQSVLHIPSMDLDSAVEALEEPSGIQLVYLRTTAGFSVFVGCKASLG